MVRNKFPAPEVDVRVVLLAAALGRALPMQTGALRAQLSARLRCPGTRSPPAPGGRKLLKAGNRDGLLFSIKGRVRDPRNEASEPSLQGMTPPAAQGWSLRAGEEP